jgi:DNA-directed RNA polymerase subunit RPC12/RpoP
LVMLIDRNNNLEIIEGITSIETNHDQQEVKNVNDLRVFAAKAKFPSHGLILKQVANGNVQAIQKGIIHWESLNDTFLRLQHPGVHVFAETDMRAHLNPTRMEVIRQATELLMKKVASRCPECHWPGFGVVEIRNGLPCKQCGSPTQLPLFKIYRCTNCGYANEHYYSTSVERADPQYCDYCNP